MSSAGPSRHRGDFEDGEVQEAATGSSQTSVQTTLRAPNGLPKHKPPPSLTSTWRNPLARGSTSKARSQSVSPQKPVTHPSPTKIKPVESYSPEKQSSKGSITQSSTLYDNGLPSRPRSRDGSGQRMSDESSHRHSDRYDYSGHRQGGQRDEDRMGGRRDRRLDDYPGDRHRSRERDRGRDPSREDLYRPDESDYDEYDRRDTHRMGSSRRYAERAERDRRAPPLPYDLDYSNGHDSYRREAVNHSRDDLDWRHDDGDRRRSSRDDSRDRRYDSHRDDRRDTGHVNGRDRDPGHGVRSHRESDQREDRGGRSHSNHGSHRYDDYGTYQSSMPLRPHRDSDRHSVPAPPPEEEEGEIDESPRPRTPSASPPKSVSKAKAVMVNSSGFPTMNSELEEGEQVENDFPRSPTDTQSELNGRAEDSASSQDKYRPPKLSMRNRPRPPPPPAAPSETPPAPPADTPPTPPPPDFTPPPPAEGSLSTHSREDMMDIDARPHPTNKTLEKTKGRVFERDKPPQAPNPNLLQPSTQPPTPSGPRAMKEPTIVVSHLPGTYKRRTAEEEMKALRRTFQGTTTLDAYDVGSKLGEGTFGIVTKGIDVSTKRAVALKHLLTHNPRDGVSTTTIREIKILKALSHKNVVPILDMVVQPKSRKDKSGRQDIFMVFPFMDHDLCGLLGNRDFKPTVSVRKLLMKQMLEGLAYIHANNLVHRDIKTANILVDSHGGVMIADFGLARPWTGSGPVIDSTNATDLEEGEAMPPHTMNEYTNMVVTRWYRAPELLLGDTHYGPAVDMWSMGCILGEIYHREPILAAKGHTDDGQLPLILEHCGPMNDDTFPGWQDLPGYPDQKGTRWDLASLGEPLMKMAERWGMDEACAHLMKRMLTLDPKRRITAGDALDHDWFWLSPLPADVEKTTLGVDSSHEMTMRQNHQPVAPAPAYRGQYSQPPRPKPQYRPGGFQQGRMPIRPPVMNPYNMPQGGPMPGQFNGAPPGGPAGLGFNNGPMFNNGSGPQPLGGFHPGQRQPPQGQFQPGMPSGPSKQTLPTTNLPGNQNSNMSNAAHSLPPPPFGLAGNRNRPGNPPFTLNSSGSRYSGNTGFGPGQSGGMAGLPPRPGQGSWNNPSNNNGHGMPGGPAAMGGGMSMGTKRQAPPSGPGDAWRQDKRPRPDAGRDDLQLNYD